MNRMTLALWVGVFMAIGLFILFVAFGGLLVAWRRGMAAIHLPAALWGAGIELTGGICPLTPLEQSLRRAAGQRGYEGGFIEHYLAAAIYPEGLTANHQVAIGVAVTAINLALYAWVWRRAARRRGIA